MLDGGSAGLRRLWVTLAVDGVSHGSTKCWLSQALLLPMLAECWLGLE